MAIPVKIFVLAPLLVLTACVNSGPQVASYTVNDARRIPEGVACERVQDRYVQGVAGCELYITGSNQKMTAGERNELNRQFSQQVQTTVNFDFDKDVIRSDAAAILERQANWIRQHPAVHFSVFGHTDLVGSDDYNFDLAKRRADAVVRYLISRGVSPLQLDSVVSFGETTPLIRVTSPSELNRRAVTEVSGQIVGGPRRTKEELPCRMLKQEYLPTYSACIKSMSLPLGQVSAVLPTGVAPIPPGGGPGGETGGGPGRQPFERTITLDTGDSRSVSSVSDDGAGNIRSIAEVESGPPDAPTGSAQAERNQSPSRASLSATACNSTGCSSSSVDLNANGTAIDGTERAQPETGDFP